MIHRNRNSRPIFGVKLSDLPIHELPIPSVVKCCISFIEKNSLKTTGLFRIPGNVTKILSLKDRFDSGENINFVPESNPHDVCGVLKLFFREMPVPLIPIHLYRQVFTPSSNFSDFSSYRHLISLLPEHHSDLLRFLCQFLALVASFDHHNSMSLDNLALVLVPNIIRSCEGKGIEKDVLVSKDMKPLFTCFRSIIQHQEAIFSDPPESPPSPNPMETPKKASPPPSLAQSPSSPCFIKSPALDYLISETINLFLFKTPIVKLRNTDLYPVMTSSDQNSTSISAKVLSESLDRQLQLKKNRNFSKWQVPEKISNLTLSRDENSSFIKESARKAHNHDKSITDTSTKARDPFISISLEEYRSQSLKQWFNQITKLKSIIFDFESDYMQKYGTRPHKEARDPIRPHLEQYFLLTKKYRNIAAIKIQSLCRGFLTRRRVTFQSNPFRNQRLSPFDLATIRLAAIRIEEKRPYEINNMNSQQMNDEKAALKRELKHFDETFKLKNHREPEKADKECLRSLYQRYKKLSEIIKNSGDVATTGLQSTDTSPPSSFTTSLTQTAQKFDWVKESPEVVGTIMIPSISLPPYTEPNTSCLHIPEYQQCLQQRAQLRDELRRLCEQVVRSHRMYIETEKKMNLIEKRGSL
ncbi:hypothetical protein RCL1_003561 [Eukaryota sp. TZLM3-RCL]